VIVSNNAANRTAEHQRRGVLTVVPVTSSTGNVHPFQVLLAAGEAGLAVTSKAQAEQVRAVDFVCLRRKVGSVDPASLDRIDAALRRHLSL
jgi:mRNA interferase MazF